jgi:hypothetical protein
MAANFVFNWVADAFGCDGGLVSASTEKASPTVKALWEEFIKVDPPAKTKALFFFYQASQDSKDATPIVILTDGLEMSLNGKCVFAARVSDQPLKNPQDDITLGVMESELLLEMDSMLSVAVAPVLQAKQGAFAFCRNHDENATPPSSDVVAFLAFLRLGTN